MKYSVLTTSISNNFKHYKIFIHSINIQNPLPQELVFVNDGIKFEKIKDYLASLLNKKIKLVYHKNKINLGITKSLNLGIKKVNTKLIFRLDIDDEWLFNHSRVMLKEYKQDNNYLIYSNSSIGYIRGLADQNLLIDNPTIHSSWVINLHKKYNFKYLNYNPEDYATLSYYFQKNFRFKLVKKKTVVYNDNPYSFSKKKIANKDLGSIRSNNLKFYLKQKSILSLFYDLKINGLLKLFKNYMKKI